MSISHIALRLACASVAACSGIAVADVTVQEQSTVSVAFMKAHTTDTRSIAGDKSRSETQFSCDGMMSMLCGHKKNVEILRLDQGVTWDIDAKKKTYTEVPLPTPEQTRAMVERQRAAVEKLKSCPQMRQAQTGPDTSKCEMSEPRVSVTKTQDVANIAGHNAQRTNLTMTQSCKVKSTGEECELDYSFDVWLTQEEIAGLSERQKFQLAYARKLGLTPGSLANPALSKAMAPYADSLKQLAGRSSDLKGYPLRTQFRFAYGGPRCGTSAASPSSSGSPGVVQNAGSAAGSAAENSATSAAGYSASDSVERSAGNGPGGYIAGSAAGAFARNLVGGMFAKKSAPSTASDTSTTTAQPVGAKGDPLKTVAEFTMETTSIDAGVVAPTQFELPQGLKKIVPDINNDGTNLPNCSAS